MHWRDAMNKKNQEWINDKGRKPKEIVTKPATQEYKDNWDKIFGNKKEKVSGTSNHQEPTE